MILPTSEILGKGENNIKLACVGHRGKICADEAGGAQRVAPKTS
jgi:hypothetical protein